MKRLQLGLTDLHEANEMLMKRRVSSGSSMTQAESCGKANGIKDVIEIVNAFIANKGGDTELTKVEERTLLDALQERHCSRLSKVPNVELGSSESTYFTEWLYWGAWGVKLGMQILAEKL